MVGIGLEFLNLVISLIFASNIVSSSIWRVRSELYHVEWNERRRQLQKYIQICQSFSDYCLFPFIFRFKCKRYFCTIQLKTPQRNEQKKIPKNIFVSISISIFMNANFTLGQNVNRYFWGSFKIVKAKKATKYIPADASTDCRNTIPMICRISL